MPPPRAGEAARGGAGGLNGGFNGGRGGYGGAGGYGRYGKDGYEASGTNKGYRESACFNYCGFCYYGCVAWIVFICASVVMGFLYHNNETLIWILLILGGLFTAGYLYNSAMRYTYASTDQYGARTAQRNDLVSILVTTWLLVAAIGGFSLGLLAHEKYIRKFWLSQELAVRQNVMPSEPAIAYLNAGEIGFAEEARIDMSKTIGYKDQDVYCVAPIAGDAPLEKVQFWAAGMNCCGARSGFVCDDAWNSKARSGIVIHDHEHSRLVPDMRPYFLKAVKMAEKTYEIASVQEPVFVHWVVYPDVVEFNFFRNGFGLIVGGSLLACLCCICVDWGLNSYVSLAPNLQEGYSGRGV